MSSPAPPAQPWTASPSPQVMGYRHITYMRKDGAGMYNISCSDLTLANLIFSGNMAMNGGGMYNLSSSLTLTNVIFSANPADSDGTGMYNSSSSRLLQTSSSATIGHSEWRRYSKYLRQQSDADGCHLRGNKGVARRRYGEFCQQSDADKRHSSRTMSPGKTF